MVKVVTAEPIEGYRLKVLLSNGKQGTFDVTPYVKAAFGGVMWPHEQDFSAETIEIELRQEDRSNPSLQRTA